MIDEKNKQLLFDFAEIGYEFFPLLKPRGKLKLSPPTGWPDMSTSDRHQIELWMETAIAGFGMTFGLGLMCIDLDGLEGIESFKEFMKKYDIPEPKIVFKTPSGGRHLWYKKNSDIRLKNVAGVDFEGHCNKDTKVDIRATGGFIGSFGARNNGYELIVGKADTVLSVLPDDVLKSLPYKKETPNLAASAMSLTKDLVATLDKSTDSSLFGEMPKIVYDGTRNTTLFNLVASWTRTGLSKKTQLILCKEFRNRCEGDTSDLDFEDIIDRTLGNPDFVFAKRSKALQVLLKECVFLSTPNVVTMLSTMERMSVSAFKVKFSSRIQIGEKKNGDPKYKPLADTWISDDSKMVYTNWGYKPGGGAVYYDPAVGMKLLNIYKAPKVKPRPNMRLFDKFCEFASVICGDSDEKGMILVEYFAFLLQNPSEKVGIAPVLISTNQGIGKNFFMKIISRVLGGSNVTQLYSDNITSNFNSSISTNQLIAINESLGAGNGTTRAQGKAKQAMERIKSMITDYVQPVERKGVDIVPMTTYTNFIFFSNNKSAVSFDMTDRRFLCIINNLKARSREFFDSMDVLKTDEGVAAIIDGLENLEMFRIQKNMVHTEKTSDDLEVFRSGLTNHESVIHELITDKVGLMSSDYITIQSFKWLCVHEFGMDIQKDKTFITRLLKRFYSPLRCSDTVKVAKEVCLKVPTFRVELRNGSETVTFGGEAKHRVYYRSDLVDRTAKQVDSFRMKSEIEEGINAFIKEIGGEAAPPALAMVS